MESFLKSLIIVSVSICFSLHCFSENEVQKSDNPSVNSSKSNDSLKSQIIKLEKITDDGSYTRIPNKDFDNIIDNKIQKSLRETVNWWLIVIGALISVLGFLANKYAKAYLQTIVDGKINQLKKENEEKIKSTSTHYFSTVIDSLLDFKLEKIMKQNNIVEEWVVDDLMTYLTDDSITIKEPKKVLIIDTIMRCYYYSRYDQRLEKMIALIKAYEGKLILYGSTYFNAAIAFSDMYDRYGAKDFLNSAIENCNKSIKILPDYGLAFALKLELYTIALSNAFDDAEHKQYENELLKVFKDIENNTSQGLCPELIGRLEVDKESFMEPHLEKLYQEYPDQMAKIKARADAVSPVVTAPVNA